MNLSISAGSLGVPAAADTVVDEAAELTGRAGALLPLSTGTAEVTGEAEEAGGCGVGKLNDTLRSFGVCGEAPDRSGTACVLTGLAAEPRGDGPTAGAAGSTGTNDEALNPRGSGRLGT